MAVLAAIDLVLESKTMSEKSAVSRTSASWGWRPKLGVFLLILALVSTLLVPWPNRGAFNLGESG